jgi:hypothetical protein
MTINPLVEGFRVSAAMRPYALRLRLRGRDFDFGNSPEAAVAFSKCIEEMRKILLGRRIPRRTAELAISRTLQIAADFRLAELREAAIKQQNAAAQASLKCLTRRLRNLRNIIDRLARFPKGRLNSEVRAVFRRSPFDTEVFIEVIDTVSAGLAKFAPRCHADGALEIIHPNSASGTGTNCSCATHRMVDRCPPLIEQWETMPATTRANVERRFRDKPPVSLTHWLGHVASLLELERPRDRPPYSVKRRFVFPVAKIWHGLGLTVGLAYKPDKYPDGIKGGHGGAVDSWFQRYCHAALGAFGMTDNVSEDFVLAAKKYLRISRH